jgi:hypothetical protein
MNCDLEVNYSSWGNTCPECNHERCELCEVGEAPADFDSMGNRNGEETTSIPTCEETSKISMPIVPGYPSTMALGKNQEDLIASSAWSDASSVITFDNASIFSNESASTGQSSVYDPLGAAEDFIAILLNDAELDPLFVVAKSAIDSQTFKVELHQLLRRYSKDLYQEAQSPLDKVAINFVRRYRRRIAYAVGDDVYQLNTKKTSGKSNKAEVIEQYLQQLPELRAAQDSDSSEDENDQEEPLSNLQRVKDFLVSSRAYDSFKAAVIQFVLAKTEPPPSTVGSCSVSSVSLDGRLDGPLYTAETVFTTISETESSSLLSKDIPTTKCFPTGLELRVDLEICVPGSFPPDDIENNTAGWSFVGSELGFVQKLHYLLTRCFRPTPQPGIKRIEWLCVRSYKYQEEHILTVNRIAVPHSTEISKTTA